MQENSDPLLFPSISGKNIMRRGVGGSDSLAKGDLESVEDYGTACGIVGSSSCLDSTLKSNSHPSPGSLSFEHVKVCCQFHGVFDLHAVSEGIQCFTSF